MSALSLVWDWAEQFINGSADVTPNRPAFRITGRHQVIAAHGGMHGRLVTMVVN